MGLHRLKSTFTISGHMDQLRVCTQLLRSAHLLKCILVFTIVAAFWTKVNYHLMQLAPWRSLAAGQTSAKQSLLLDYISAWNVGALFTSAKARHFDVTAGIAATLLMQLMIVFSTGLFALEPQTIQRSGVSVTPNFNFAYRPNVTIDSRDFMTALALQDYGLEYRHGTSEHFAYQTFNFSSTDLRKYNLVLTGGLCAMINEVIVPKHGHPNFESSANINSTKCNG